MSGRAPALDSSGSHFQWWVTSLRTWLIHPDEKACISFCFCVVVVKMFTSNTMDGPLTSIKLFTSESEAKSKCIGRIGRVVVLCLG